MQILRCESLRDLSGRDWGRFNGGKKKRYEHVRHRLRAHESEQLGLLLLLLLVFLFGQEKRVHPGPDGVLQGVGGTARARQQRQKSECTTPLSLRMRAHARIVLL